VAITIQPKTADDCYSENHYLPKLLLWKKKYTNSNVVLYTLSRYAGVPSRFMAVASQYGIHSLRQTAGTVKFAVWKFFTETVHVLILFCLMLYCTLVCVFYVFYVCILSLPSGVINK